MVMTGHDGWGPRPPALHESRAPEHFATGGFCGVCGLVWPCASQRRRRNGAAEQDRATGIGYLHLRTSDPASDRVSGPRRSPEMPSQSSVVSMLESFATSCGYSLGEVFVDDTPPRLLGWASLVHAVVVSRPVAVLVPDVPGWRPADGVLRTMAARLARVTSAPLVIVRPSTAPPSSDRESMGAVR